MTIQADRTLAKTTPRAAFSRVRLLVSAVAWVVAPLLAVGCSDSGRRSLTPQQTADAGVSEQDSGTTDDAGQSKPPLSLPQCSQALDRSTATVFYDAARCLFEGADAPQEGVATGTINPERVAIVRGRLLEAAGSPLVGAKVTVLKHGEFGSTESRWDGYFDMAVNGGDALTLRFQKDSFLMSQRHVQTRWRQFGVRHPPIHQRHKRRPLLFIHELQRFQPASPLPPLVVLDVISLCAEERLSRIPHHGKIRRLEIIQMPYT